MLSDTRVFFGDFITRFPVVNTRRTRDRDMDEITSVGFIHDETVFAPNSNVGDNRDEKVLSPKPSSKTTSKATTAVASPSLSKTSTFGDGRKSYRNIPTEVTSPAIVPKVERRGLFSKITLVPEQRISKDYARRTKWLITFTVAAGAAIVTTV